MVKTLSLPIRLHYCLDFPVLHLSPIESVWSIISEQLVGIIPPSTTPDRVRQYVKAAWNAASTYASTTHPKPHWFNIDRVPAVVASRCCNTQYWFHHLTDTYIHTDSHCQLFNPCATCYLSNNFGSDISRPLALLGVAFWMVSSIVSLMICDLGLWFVEYNYIEIVFYQVH